MPKDGLEVLVLAQVLHIVVMLELSLSCNKLQLSSDVVILFVK